ncbi:hypothetical protein [Methylobacterium sp. A54F]
MPRWLQNLLALGFFLALLGAVTRSVMRFAPAEIERPLERALAGAPTILAFGALAAVLAYGFWRRIGGADDRGERR